MIWGRAHCWQRRPERRLIGLDPESKGKTRAFPHPASGPIRSKVPTMTTAALSKVPAKTAAEVCKKLNLEDEAKALLKPESTPVQYLDLLVENALLHDAVRFLATALPKQEAVWWACRCVRTLVGPKLATPALTALQSAEKWAADPVQATCQAAQAAAESAGNGTPAGCAALAAFWSGGSLAPANLPAVPPPEGLTAQGVGAAILLAVAQADPVKAPANLRQCLTIGTAVGNGADRWQETKK
jgi:uncharacterized protein DUF6931